jgi:hypothetical protein
MEQVQLTTPLCRNLAAMVVFPFNLQSATVECVKAPIVT